MRIGFDAKRAFVNTSGLGNYSRFTVSSLLRLFPQEHYFLYTPKQLALFKNFYENTAPPPELVMPGGLWKKLPAVWRTFALAPDAKRKELDIFHGLSNELPRGMHLRTKTVVTIHDLIFIRYPEHFTRIDRSIYQNKFRRACENAHRIVAISEQTKQDILHFYGIEENRIEVVYQDCDAIFHLPPDKALQEQVRQKYHLPAQYVLCVGTHEPRKNQLNLLKAWHQSGTHLHLVLIGKQTRYSSQLHEYIAAHKLQKRVHLLPYIPFQELPAIYQQATVFAYPSLFEGFGIPIVEALNSGVPVITSTGSCFSEAGGEHSRYTNPTDTQQLSQAIVDLSGDATLRERMATAGRAHALTFRPDRTITQLHSLYQKLAEA